MVRGTFVTIALAAAWLLEAAVAQLVGLVGSLLAGSFSYMGRADLSALQVAIHGYSGDIGRLLGHLFLWDAAVLALLALPFTPVFIAWARRGLLGALVRGVVVLAVLRLTVIAVAMIRIPTLFADIYWGDGGGPGARVMQVMCSHAGIVVLAVVWLGVLFAAARGAGWARAGGAVALLAVAALALLRMETRRADVVLPPGSVVLYFADSLRADVANAKAMPALTAEADARGAVIVAHVVPPLARTAPALVSLFTGKLPEEHGVTTMFSPESTFKQPSSIAHGYAKRGFCTVAVGDYPAEFMRKIDLGFKINDTPLVRFREIALQLLLAKDPFAAATLTFRAGRRAMWSDERNLFHGLPTFADTSALHERFADAVRGCAGKPVFAFIFADQPHFPYVQTWPHYLALDGAYRGRYRWSKDAVSSPSTDADRQRIRDLYAASVRADDEGMADFVRMLAGNGSLDRATVVFSGDHGESLYDHLGIMGHGDQLAEMEGIEVPWIVFGAKRERFKLGAAPLSSIHLTPILAALNDVHTDVVPALPRDVVYLQTGEWLADTPNVPAERVVYPELSDLLMVRDKDAHIEVKPEYARIIEYAKHRSFFLPGGDRWDLVPAADHVTWKKNGRAASYADVPALIKDLLGRLHVEIAPLWAH